MSDLTPETLAELRRLLERATPGPWHAWDRGIGYEVHTEAEHNPIRCVSLNSEFRETFRGPDARLIAAAVNALPALLDAAAERDEIAGRLAHLLCDLTGGRMSKTSYPVPVMAQEIEQYLSECHESDLKDERDALAAAVERVRELHKPEGIHRFCSMCAYRPWPCPTIRALDTTPDAGGES